MRRDILAKDVANREHLYTEFLKEVETFIWTRFIEPSTTRPSRLRSAATTT